MRVLQGQHITRKIALVAGGVSHHAGEPGQIDVAQGRGTTSEPVTGMRELSRRQDVAEGAVECSPVMLGGHGMSLARSPLLCKVMT